MTKTSHYGYVLASVFSCHATLNTTTGIVENHKSCDPNDDFGECGVKSACANMVPHHRLSADGLGCSYSVSFIHHKKTSLVLI